MERLGFLKRKTIIQGKNLDNTLKNNELELKYNSKGKIVLKARDGVEVKTVSSGYQDSPTPIEQPNDEIWYTTTTGEIAEIVNIEEQAQAMGFEVHYGGPEVISNTYENGKGIIKFAEPLTWIGFDLDNLVYGPGFPCNPFFRLPDTHLETISLPNSITTLKGVGPEPIGLGAFTNCWELKEIVLPKALEEIGACTFAACPNLSSITIPSSVTSIGFMAFGDDYFIESNFINNSGLVDEDNWGALIPPKEEGYTEENGFIMLGNTIMLARPATTIDIPEGVTELGPGSFSIVMGNVLVSVTIPNSVTTIGTIAFDNNDSLESVKCLATVPPTLGNYVFRDTGDCPIYVPSDSVEAYKAATGWSEYANRIQAIPE